jgi:inosine-uridine nucleoside N-ribohydrolase
MPKILLDCDPGHDDMVAMVVAVTNPDIQLLGVSTVAGNQTGERTFRNAGKVLTLLHAHETPLARGCDQPMVRQLQIAADIHGSSGLDGAELPEPTVVPEPEHALEFLEETLRASPSPVILVPTGPLTNIGMLLRKSPSIAEKIERVVLMGGAVRESNVTPAAEFNIFVDPEAATVVFQAGVPITMVGLDVTKRAVLTEEEIDAVGDMGGEVSGIVAGLLRFYAGAYRERFGLDGAPLHDAVAVMAAADPEILQTRHLRVDVETAGIYTRGRTVVDLYGVTGRPPNADVAVDIDLQRFKSAIFDAVRSADRRAERRR